MRKIFQAFFVALEKLEFDFDRLFVKGIRLLACVGFCWIQSAWSESAVVEGELLLKYVEGANEKQRSDFEVAHGLSRVQFHHSIGVYHYSFQNADLWLKISEVRASEIVYFAEPNYLRQRQSVPNDPFFEFQWYLPKVRWDESRNESTGSNLVTVAVIDSGVSKAHSHLLGYLLQKGEWDFADGDSDANDESGHGTMVAGIITGNTDEGVGVAGICENARILPIRVFDNAGFIAEGSTVDASVLISALDQARLSGAKVVNLSLGGSAYSYFESLAVDKCHSAGMLLVCAAGNGGSDGFGDNNDVLPTYPASYPSDCILSVAATDENDELTIFSNFGSTSVDIAAPGQFIVGCDVPRSTLYEWTFNSGWEGWNSVPLSGYGWVWDNFTGEWGLSTRGSPFSFLAGFYAANSSMFLSSPLLDLRGEVGARAEFDVSGSLGFDDYISLSFLDAQNESHFMGIISYPGWNYGSLNVDISAFDGTLGQLDINFLADLFGWGIYSSGIFTFENIRVTSLDQSAWAADSIWYSQGTSFSAPIVTGVAAAIFSQAPNLTAVQVKNLILTNARPVSKLNGKLLYPAVVDYAAALRASKVLATPGNSSPALQFLDEIIGTWKGRQTIYLNGTKVIANLTSVNQRHGQRGLYITNRIEIEGQPPVEGYQYLYDNGQTQGGFLPGTQPGVDFSFSGTWSSQNRSITQTISANFNGEKYTQQTQSIIVDKNTLNVFSTTSDGARVLGTSLKDSGPTPSPSPSPSPSPALNLSILSGDFLGNFEGAGSRGQVALKIGKAGAITGSVVTAAGRSAIRGKFSSSGGASVAVVLPTGSLELLLKTRGLEDGRWDAADEVYLEAIFSSSGSSEIPFELRPAPRNGRPAAPLVGKTINTMLESRNDSENGFGFGFAGVKLGRAGVFRFTGALADGTRLTGTARAVEDADGGWKLPVAMPLASVKGFLHGEAMIDSNPAAAGFHLASKTPWTWTRPANPTAKSFQQGFEEKLTVRGREWKWTRGTSALGGISANFTLALSFGDNGGGFVPAAGVDGISGTLGANNKPVWFATPPRGFAMTITPATGLVRGRITGALDGKSAELSYLGMVFPNDMPLESGNSARGAGFVTGSGWFALRNSTPL